MSPDRKRRLSAVCVTLALVIGAFGGAARVSAVAGADACSVASEPDDRIEDAPRVEGAFCASGTLPENDQDLTLWTVSPAAALFPWTFRIEGVPRTITSIHVLPVTSAPDVTAITVGAEVLRVDSSSESREPGVMRDVRLSPGRYVLGVSKGTNTGPALDDLDYQVSVEQPDERPPLGDVEPNDAPGDASAVAGGFLVVGDLQGSADDYRWTIDADGAAHSWDLDVRALPGATFSLTLETDEGAALANAFVGPDAHAHLYDLRLPAGSYRVRLGAGTVEPRPYVLGALAASDPHADAEPNDVAALALPLAPGVIARGRLAGTGDVDTYRLTVDAAFAATQLDIRLEGATGPSRQVCVSDAAGAFRHCRQGQGGSVRVSNLLLPAVGDYLVEVSGTDRLTDGYELSIDELGPVAADREIEPDDAPGQASPLDVLQPLRGRADGIDDDVYRVRVSGRPQLWRLDVTGDALEGLTWIREDTLLLGTGALAPEGGRLVLRDLWLLPGDHWFAIRARDSDYLVTFTPLGQPPTDGELEPNNDAGFAGSMAPGEQRVGRLTDLPDIDVYRFSLAAIEHLAIVLEPPVDGAASFRLDSSDVTLADVPPAEPGETVRYEGQLPAGDYVIWVRPTVPSEDSYTLSLERADPFTDGVTPVIPLPVTLALEPDVATVAAWSTDGQRVEGTLTITSTSADEQVLELEARTSDDAWSVELATTRLTVAPGETRTVPISVAVPMDAWADVPVRITIGARDGTGAWASGFADVRPVQDAPPVAPEQAWTLPRTLLGGLDVAAAALGGAPLPGPDPTREALLHDGYAVPGVSWQASLAGGPAIAGVDLAGEVAIPIAGFVVDPLGGETNLSWRPRHVEFLLSEDGVDYQVVLAAEVSPVMREQAFVLDPPVPARFARLRISSGWSATGTSVALGEWKVVAQPGVLPDSVGAPFNLADPVLGGHVVSLESVLTDDVTVGGMLTEDATPWLINPEDGAQVRWTLGFRDDRMAAITELQWADPAGADPATLLAAVEVEVSSSTTLGPWTPLETWVPTRAPDGSVAPLVLAGPVWARFVRFTTAGPVGPSVNWAMPATLRILERATDDTYRSILGEWGRWERRGIAELLAPPALAPTPPDVPQDTDDEPATATTLGIGAAVPGEVRRGSDVDWYAVTMPAEHDLLALSVGGAPFAAAGVSLQDGTGTAIAMEPIAQAGPVAVWTAVVEPGATYHVRVEQLPVSTAFTYDSSGSMIRYLPFIADALRTFAGGVRPGSDAALIIPFQGAPLLDHWSDDPFELQGAVAAQTTFPSGSSAAEQAMLDALAALGRRPGTRALVVLTDAETNTRAMAPSVLDQLETLRPLVFTVHMGDLGDPVLTTHLMQDWAASSAGTYQVTVSHREIDRTFQRIAAWLRRPAAYTLTATTSAIPKEPGTLHVTAATPRAGAVGGVTIELVLDTSGSMLKKLGRARRIDVAERVLTRLVTETLPAGIPAMLRTFVALPDSCDTTLAVPLGPLDPAVMAMRIGALKVAGSTRTPLGATLRAVGDDLADVQGRAIVVFVTDGQETCKGDPAREIQRLIDQGIDVQVNIVGFAIDDRKLTRDLARWAALGNGTAYDADNEGELAEALTLLLRAPFTVFDAQGLSVATGLVGGDPVPLPVGTYRVEVQTEPPITLDRVVIGSGTNVDLVVGEEE